MVQRSSRELRFRRKARGRKKLSGTAERPRLSVFRSSKHLYAQVIDDESGKTLANIHSFGASSRAGVEQCTELGKQIASKCAGLKIAGVVFDKNGFQYHGRVKAFADGAREGGLKF